jgi:acyl transferase domain-containing protein/acyl carrier protein
VLLSARTPSALDAATEHLADHFNGELADVAFTLRHGRRAFPERRFVVASDRDDAVAALRDPQRAVTGSAPQSRPSVAFLFPGLGDHYAGMGWELYCTESVFRDSIDRSAELMKEHLEGDIRDFLYPGRDWLHPRLEQPAKSGADLDLRAMLGRKRGAPDDPPAAAQPAAAQPAIFITEVALAELLRHWGIEPEAMIGHSIGEFAAAQMSGVLSLPDAIAVVAARARLIQTHVRQGAMLAVPLSDDELMPLLPAGVSLAAVNAPRLCVASGEEAGIVELAAELGRRGVSSQRLRSTHAYHSAMMEAIVEPLRAVLRRVELRAPRIPYVSCITGTWITDAEATDPNYWARHLCNTVRFSKGLATLLEDPRRVLFETGPGQGLTSHAIALRKENAVIPSMRWSYGLQSELAVLLRGVGQLWVNGVALDTSQFLSRPLQRRVQLPTYPFERQRYWIDPPSSFSQSAEKNADIAGWFYLPAWKPALRAQEEAEFAGRWLIVADRFGVAEALASELRARGASVEVASVESVFENDFETPPDGVIHLATLTAGDDSAPSAGRFAEMQELGYECVMHVLRNGCTRVEIVTNHVDDIPEKSTLRAPALVAPQEHPNVVCRMIETDLDVAPSDERAATRREARRRDALVAQILDEISSAPGDSIVAYRRGSRFVSAYEPVRLEESLSSPLRSRGVYLITGGLGGVGMLLARHLAERVQARLVLLGRSAPSEEKLRQIAELEQLGAEVLVVAADVSKRDDMQHVLAAIDARFGELHGVIHGAGAVGLETFREIREATPADSELQFVAKVRGLLVLDEVLAGRPLDFCLLMSSLSAILGGLGFAAYSAANQFMDAFVRWRNRYGATRWTSVDWDSWRTTDARRPAINGLGATVSEYIMEPHEGAAAFERILSARTLSQVVVSTGDLEARLRQWIGHRDTTTASPLIQHDRPQLRTPYEAPRGEIELELASIWQELFGISSVGIHDNFFELGGHSLLATQLNARLASRFHVEMSLATLLQTTTIEELAIAVVSHQAAMADPEALERLLAEVGALSGSGDE